MLLYGERLIKFFSVGCVCVRVGENGDGNYQRLHKT